MLNPITGREDTPQFSTQEVLQGEDVDNTLDPNTGLPQDIVDAIITLSRVYEEEDKALREVMQSFWKKLENYWNGIQRIFWDSNNSDWRRVDTEGDTQNDLDPTLYDKIINIYRAHGEAITAALSIKLPSTVFYPDDADVYEDVETAKACSKIKKLVEKHNAGILILIKSIFYLFNTGVVAAYIYNRRNKNFGTYQVPKFASQPVKITTATLTCPGCGNGIQQIDFKDVPVTGLPEITICPTCELEAQPEVELTEELLPKLEGYNDEPKSRTIIEVFSPLFVYMPFYARKQELMPYLRLRFEQHYSLLKKQYPKLSKANLIPKGGTSDPQGNYTRSYSYLYGSDNNNLVTTDCLWLRPWSFQMLEDEELIKRMEKQFPDGLYAVIIKGQVAEAYNEALDDHWEISVNPLSNYLHADPIGKPLAPIQELKNETTDLAIDTFEHAIPETFADAEVLDFNQYGKSDAKPGTVFPVKKPMDGKSIGESFFSLKTATLNEEIESFNRRLDTDGQFVVGSFPSIYGGPAQSGSKTAKEYTESRAMALQRLNSTWTLLKIWYAKVMSKAVPLFIKSMVQDEKYVEKTGSGLEASFVNVWIRKSQLEGKLGSVEADPEEDLPLSANQLKSVFMELITVNNDFMNEALYHPQNTPVIAKALGAPDFYIPGQDDRNKQYAEIAELINSQPIDEQTPSVMVDMVVDNHAVEAEVCRTFMISSTGLALRKFNPLGYMNVQLHYQMHVMSIPKEEPVQESDNPEEEKASV